MTPAHKNSLIPVFLALAIISLFISKAHGRDFEINLEPISSFLPSSPEQKVFGKLEFLGGGILSSDNKDFGGLLGIEFRKGQDSFIAITDKARFITAEIMRDEDRITGITRATLTRTRNSSGKIITGARDKDAEAITLTPDNQILLGYERNDRIAVFNEKNHKLIQDRRSKTINLNEYEFPNNKGVEALVISSTPETLLVFTEHALNKQGNHRAFSITNNEITEFAIKVPDGYSITDAALLPDNRLILLERYYSIFTGPYMRIRRFEVPDLIAKDQLLEGETLMQANSNYEIDNMEGLAITTMKDGSNRLTLVSDDNFSKDQRTILIEFKLLD